MPHRRFPLPTPPLPSLPFPTSSAGSGALGATQTSGLVDIPAFHAAAIAPELAAGAQSQGAGCDRLPLLKAAALKFVATFRAQLPVDSLRAVLPLLAGLLQSRHVVIHTYAAHCLERLLTTKAAAPAGGGAPAGRALSPADVGAQLQPLLAGLFAALSRPASAESDYLMRAVLRLCASAGGAALAPHVGSLLESLKSILGRVCANPSAPTFNHYLFETVAVLVRETCAVQPEAVSAFGARARARSRGPRALGPTPAARSRAAAAASPPGAAQPPPGWVAACAAEPACKASRLTTASAARARSVRSPRAQRRCSSRPSSRCCRRTCRSLRHMCFSCLRSCSRCARQPRRPQRPKRRAAAAAAASWWR